MQLFECNSPAVEVYSRKVDTALLKVLVTKTVVPQATFSTEAQTGCSYFIP